MSGYAAEGVMSAFDRSGELFQSLVGVLSGPEADAWTHAQLEEHLQERGRELMRQLVQDRLDLRALREERGSDVTDADGVLRTRVEGGHRRGLGTIFGSVTVERMAYRAPGAVNLYPADSLLNLPIERHSHGLRRVAALESVRGSFADATTAIGRHSGVTLGKRQAEALAQAAAVDIDAFYAVRRPDPRDAPWVLVLSVDGKGIVMRPEALRDLTARAAKTTSRRLASRLSPGEKLGRKRMAEVGAVYDCLPVTRTPEQIMTRDGEPSAPGPTAQSKWLTASVAQPAAEVIAAVFDEAARRDPQQRRPWVILVDGNNHQLDRIHAEAQARHVTITIVIDFIHVLEYLWKAAWSFFYTGDPDAEAWVADQARKILAGNSRNVAAGIRRRATRSGYAPDERRNADTCADYLTAKQPYLDYATALQQGWPIATGIIEGACRHLVKDRMDLTGARWGLTGAEAILKLRALTSNGDFDTYWQFHLRKEHQRVHQTRYHHTEQPTAA